MTHIQQLRNQIERIEHPSTIRKVNGEIVGAGFFPGASGVSDDFRQAEKQILVLGQDQDREEGFNKSIGRKGEDYTPTWRHIKYLFREVGIKLEDCFFTNCLLGVRVKSSTNMGKSPGFGDPSFVAKCAQLLKEEIEFFQPKIILCLGLIPFRFLGLLSKEILHISTFTDEFKELDKWSFQLTEEKNLLDQPVQIVVLCHPSYRKLNVHHRKYKSWQGEEAEKQLLMDSLRRSAIYR